MARYLDIHPQNPQPRLISQVVAILQAGGLLAYPTSSGYALACQLGNKSGLNRIRNIRKLDEKHNFTLLFSEFSQIGQFVELDNDVFRLVKAYAGDGYTFILKASKEAPKMMLQPKRKSVGVRLTKDPLSLAILAELSTPLVTSSLILPGAIEPMNQGWLVESELGYEIDILVDTGECGMIATTIVDFTDTEEFVKVLRVGAGDPMPFS